MSHAHTIRVDLPRKRHEERQMHERRCRMPPKRKRVEEQHFDSGGKRGVEVVGDTDESMRVQISRHQPKVIPGAIGTGFWRERMEEIKNEERQEGQQVARPSGSPVEERPRWSRYQNTAYQKHPPVRQVQTA